MLDPEKLRARMEAEGVSISELAGRVGVSRQGVYNLLSGRNQPRQQTLQKICEVLECNPNELLADELERVLKMEKTQVGIYEVRTADGGVGLLFDGEIHMGYDAGDLLRLLREVFPGSAHRGRPLDGDLLDLASCYLDEDRARQREEELRGW